MQFKGVRKKTGKGGKGKAIRKIKKNEKPKDVRHYLVQESQILISAHARAK